MTRERVRLLVACVATLAVVLPLAYLWQQSRVPATYLLKRMVVEVPFVVFAALLPFV